MYHGAAQKFLYNAYKKIICSMKIKPIVCLIFFAKSHFAATIEVLIGLNLMASVNETALTCRVHGECCCCYSLTASLRTSIGDVT